MNGGKEARAEHRATVERAIGLLDAERERFEGNSKPLSYSKVQYGDYAAGLALPEAQRGQFYAGMLDYYFTGVEPTHFNRQQHLVFAGIKQRVLNARAQALSKSGANLPKVWGETIPESAPNAGAKPQAYLTGANGTVPAVSGTAGAHLGTRSGVSAGASLGGGAVPPTTNYGLSAIAHKAIADMPSTHEQGANAAREPQRAELYALGKPLSMDETLAPCPKCGTPLPMYADGRGKPMVHCPDCDLRLSIELPEDLELIEVIKGSGTYALRKKGGIEKGSREHG